MNYWDSVGRWINTLLVFIVSVLAFDTLFRMLEANESNIIVAFVRGLTVVFLMPFQSMFGEQEYVLTALMGVLGYALLAGIALGVLRSLQASRAQPAPPVRPDTQGAEGVAERPTSTPRTTDRTDAAAPTSSRPTKRRDPDARPAEQLERATSREHPDRARTNGRARARRPRSAADGGERARPDRTGRTGRERTRDRAAAEPAGTGTPEAETGS
jgi:hypothetical protein